jgi:hypothetical protein
MRIGHRDAGRARELAQLRRRFGIDDTATGDDQRPLRRANHRDRSLQRRRLGHRPADMPDARGEEGERPVIRLGLHILRQARW